jgi:uncharacterized protein (UPF0276 family)
VAAAGAAAAEAGDVTSVDADRFGLGWRPELAAGILANLDRIDVVEVIADDLFDAPPALLNGLRAFGGQCPILLHGVGLGAASTSPIDAGRAEAIARAIDAVRPEAWSEHLAFVRAGGVEIGHLAAPPRTAATVDGAAHNLAAAARITGAVPLIENVATLIDPPGSVLDELGWLTAILDATPCDLLLDLHNLHANAVNFGFDAAGVIARLPAHRIRAIHLAGGSRVGGRILDDHLHDVPDPVFDLLVAVGRRATRPLTVILERDGAYPPMPALLDEMDRARAALTRGREARA